MPRRSGGRVSSCVAKEKRTCIDEGLGQISRYGCMDDDAVVCRSRKLVKGRSRKQISRMVAERNRVAFVTMLRLHQRIPDTSVLLRDAVLHTAD